MKFTIFSLSALLGLASADIIAYSGSNCDGDAGWQVAEDICINIDNRHSFRTVSKNDADTYASIWTGDNCSGNENGYSDLEEGKCYNIDTGNYAGGMKLYHFCHASSATWGTHTCASIKKHIRGKRDEIPGQDDAQLTEYVESTDEIASALEVAMKDQVNAGNFTRLGMVGATYARVTNDTQV